NAIGRRLLERGLIDYEFIKNHTDNYQKYRAQILSLSIKQAAKICGVSEKDIKMAADMIGLSDKFISMWAMGLNQSVIGTDKNVALINLSLITGQVGKPGAGPFSLTGQPNAMGGREVGGMASLLAVHKDLNNPTHRKEVADFWGVNKISPKPGLSATEMFDALEKGDLKAIWIIGTNPLVSMPNSRRVEKALSNAKFVVVQDISHKSDTTKYADLLLPASAWLEKEGTMTNSERRISYLPKVLQGPKQARADVEILCDFANYMGFRGFNYQSSEEIYREYCQMTKDTRIDISGLNYQRLKSQGSMQWPVPTPTHPDTPRLYEDRKYCTPNIKLKYKDPYRINNATIGTSVDYPLIITSDR